MLESWSYSSSLPWLIVDADNRLCYACPVMERTFPGDWHNAIGTQVSDLHLPGAALVSPELATLHAQNQHEGRLISSGDNKHSLLMCPFITLTGTHYTMIAVIEHQEADGRSIDVPSLFELLQQTRDRSTGTSRPLTDHDRTLIQSDKMAAVGQLAAGVAHEINNPIGYICSNLNSLSDYIGNLLELVDSIDNIGSLEQLKERRDEMDYHFIKVDIEDCITESTEGANRVRDIIAALKDFSHSDDGQFALYALEDAVTTTLRLVTNEIKYKCTLHESFPQIPNIECNSSQIKQVVMNLVVNAAHAIESTGNIWIRLGHQANWVWLEVEDDGAGIPKSLRERIFEPFFTTKKVGQGTGLGLSLSYSIVQRHHGRIELESEEGQGTRFRVWLPITQPTEN